MVLIGIVTVTVAPKFFSRSSLAEYALRDQLIASFRYAQQRAMYDQSGVCYQLDIQPSALGPQKNGSYLEPIGRVELSGDYAGLSVEPMQPIYFDGLGNAYSADCGDTPLSDPFFYTITPLGIQVEIFSTGFIRSI